MPFGFSGARSIPAIRTNGVNKTRQLADACPQHSRTTSDQGYCYIAHSSSVWQEKTEPTAELCS